MSVIVKSSGEDATRIETVTTNGIIFNSVNSNGYPTDVTIRTNVIINGAFYLDNSESASDNFLSKVVNLEVIANTIHDIAFKNTFREISTVGKFKIKAKSIGEDSFYGIASTSKVVTKIWISKVCETMDYRAFYNTTADIYCEASSKPSGWNTTWTNVTPTFGVSEAEFDAL